MLDAPSYRLKPGSLRDLPMSALGHKQTYAAQNGMSALPPISTARADMKAGAATPKDHKPSAPKILKFVPAGSHVSCRIARCHNRLTADLCQTKAKEALKLAKQAASKSQQIMLEHIAETWYRIADRIPANDS